MSILAASRSVLEKLRANGYEALFAGGCVRDMLLDREPADYDVATNAMPADVVRLFRRTIEVGAQFGVVMVMIGDFQVEVATFRSDVSYTDGRRPDAVEFTDAYNDAQRRDFTINGMFFDPISEEVIDYVGGRDDLPKRIIRTIGDPEERFSEDYLRMLRAVRFAAQLDFDIEPLTYDAISKLADRITGISGERIAIELEKALTGPNRLKGYDLLVSSGLCCRIFPEAAENISADKTRKLVSVLPEAKVSYPLALAAVFGCYRSDHALRYVAGLKLSNNQQKHIAFLLDNISLLTDEKLSLAGLKTAMASPFFDDLVIFQRAILNAEGQSGEILDKNLCRTESLRGTELLPPPLLNGFDLIALGVKQGPSLGRLTKDIYSMQLNEQLVSVDQAREWVKANLERYL